MSEHDTFLHQGAAQLNTVFAVSHRAPQLEQLVIESLGDHLLIFRGQISPFNQGVFLPSTLLAMHFKWLLEI